MNGICSSIDSIYASGFHFLMSSVYFSFFLNMIQSRYPCRCLVLTPCFCLIRFFASACSSFTDDTVFPFGDTYAPDGMTSLLNSFSDTNVWILWLSSLIIFVLSEKCFLYWFSISKLSLPRPPILNSILSCSSIAATMQILWWLVPFRWWKYGVVFYCTFKISLYSSQKFDTEKESSLGDRWFKKAYIMCFKWLTTTLQVNHTHFFCLLCPFL